MSGASPISPYIVSPGSDRHAASRKHAHQALEKARGSAAAMHHPLSCARARGQKKDGEQEDDRGAERCHALNAAFRCGVRFPLSSADLPLHRSRSAAVRPSASPPRPRARTARCRGQAPRCVSRFFFSSAELASPDPVRALQRARHSRQGFPYRIQTARTPEAGVSEEEYRQGREDEDGDSNGEESAHVPLLSDNGWPSHKDEGK